MQLMTYRVPDSWKRKQPTKQSHSRMSGSALVKVTIAIIALCLLGVGSTLYATGVQISSDAMRSTGIVASADLSLNCTTLDWGLLIPGSSITRSILVTNTGNCPLTLSLQVNNWNPTSAANYIHITWNVEGVRLQNNSATIAVISIVSDTNIADVTSFSNQIFISGTL